ncbi:MAG: FMN-binding protein [Planctomycetes bacterium]|nr:FMN-binding protein [Planctomycetota bacterium]
MKDKPYFAVVYMFVVTAFFSTVLIGFSRLTRQRVEANEQLAFERAVLAVFSDISAESNTDIHRIFVEQFVKTPQMGGAYLYYKDRQLAGYVIPVEGQGFWAPIKGVVGLALDKRTITGISFYEQSETPGLGARIVEEDFCSQFVGKMISQSGKPIGIKPSSETLQENQVHSITGATQTCIRLEKLMNEGLSGWLRSVEGQP